VRHLLLTLTLLIVSHGGGMLVESRVLLVPPVTSAGQAVP